MSICRCAVAFDVRIASLNNVELSEDDFSHRAGYIEKPIPELDGT